ncbi:phage-related regulatory protein [Ralstonia solanacearum]|nr:phage-related regulatory protein [Ralstonia solanacearum]
MVIDADPQSNATAYLMGEENLSDFYSDHGPVNLHGYFESVSRGKGFPDAPPFITNSERFGVDLIPGHPSFALREDLISNDWGDSLLGRERGLQTTFTFKYLLDQVSSNYDYAFIDMGPSLGAINRSILLGADFFLTPMSVDLFSLMAVENIIVSLDTWKDEISNALATYVKKSGEAYCVGEWQAKWRVRFLGYVMQQYGAKSVRGERRPVKSFDAILKRFGPELSRLENSYGYGDVDSALLGQVPSLFSLIPLSQLAHAPIFDMGTSDGVVGAHFAAVDDAKAMYEKIAERLFARLEIAHRRAA